MKLDKNSSLYQELESLLDDDDLSMLLEAIEELDETHINTGEK